MYPGDTNADSVVNYLDILPIGLGFGATGPERPEASLSFSQQTGPNWAQSLPASGLNYRHIDANGDGQIGNADASVVANNYGAAIDPLLPPPPPAAPRQLAPRLYIGADTVTGGQISVLEVFLDDDGSGIEAYGLGFRVDYDPDQVVPGSFDVDFSDSFLTGDGASLLTLDRELPASGQWHIAQTRRNRQNIAGAGLVARIQFQPTAVAQETIAELPLTITGIRLVSADEFATAVTGETTVIGVAGTVATREPDWARDLRLYPNPLPAGTSLTLITPDDRRLRWQLFDQNGRQISRMASVSETIDWSRLPAGTYLLRFVDKDGASITREVIKY
jgi:hypothetical protein